MGGGHAQDSPFTSWTPDVNVALDHANKNGDGGILLRVPTGAPGPSDNWRWQYSPDVYNEQEVLLEGVREGADRLKL